jgi:hypothetical protein
LHPEQRFALAIGYGLRAELNPSLLLELARGQDGSECRMCHVL